MAPKGRHERIQKLVVLNRILDGRDAASSFVLFLDTLEQPAAIVVDEVIRRALVRFFSSILRTPIS